MPSNSSNVVVMFADVVGSTSLYERLGDAEAQRLVSAALNGVREIAEKHHGEPRAELGDEVMVTFTDAGAAAATACDIHAKIPGQLLRENPDVDMRMRIGMHLGSLAKDIDMSSETIKIAQWAASNAKAEQTLATEVVIENLPRIFQAVSRYVDDETWNFISIEHVTLHEIIWDVESVTAFAGEQPTLAAERCNSVTFTYMGDILELTSERPVISVGRGNQNDLVVLQDLISRQHFSVQMSRGRCTLTDNSTNGTIIVYTDGTSQIVKKETMPLHGSGDIIVGSPPRIEDCYTIHYQCV